MKITQEQFDELPQLDRIEFRQVLFFRELITMGCWIITYVLLIYNHFLALIFLIYSLWRSFKSDKDYINKLEEKYFNIKVERKIREVKK